MTSGGIHIDDGSAQARVAACHLKGAGNKTNGAGKHAVYSPPQNAVIRPRHAHIADKSGSWRQHLLVGGWDMGVSSNDHANPTLQMMGHEVFVRCGFGMHVHNDDSTLAIEFLQ